MKKKIVFLMIFSVLFLFTKGFGSVISYKDIKKFSCFEGVGGEGPLSQLIWGNGYEYSHKMPDDFVSDEFYAVNASVSISGFWIGEGNNVRISETSVGYLTPGLNTCLFTLSSSVTFFDIAHIFGSWSGSNNLGISIRNEETVPGNGIFKLSESVFKLNYEKYEVSHTPEPGALLLLSSGILFFAAVCRKKYKQFSAAA
jgi:hypothetical protein